jgi:hypothetical protein
MARPSVGPERVTSGPVPQIKATLKFAGLLLSAFYRTGGVLMRFPLHRAKSLSSCPIAVALLAMSFFGCENRHVGRPCDLGVADDGGASAGVAVATITGQVLACPTRICLLPGAELSTDVQPYCTAECSSNDDCSDGEMRGSGADDKRCTKGYVCGVASEVGEFCCKKLCICRDFVEAPGGQIPEPASCQPGKSSCHNVN